jgi:serine/threonine kinase PknH
MAVFVSYSARDTAPAKPLLDALTKAHEEVWHDQQLAGTEAWWNATLERIRSCDVFVIALSSGALESKPCRAELEYAQALGKPILPVQVAELDNPRRNPLGAMQIIDYRYPGAGNSIELVSAVYAARAQASPLPEPLPEAPPEPFGYLMRLLDQISRPELNQREQAAVVAELRAGLEDDGADESIRSDIARLLHALRDRSDVMWSICNEIDAVLASLESSEPFPTYQPAPPPTYPHVKDPAMYPTAPPGSGPPPPQWYPTAPPPRPRRSFPWSRKGSTGS